MRMKDFDNIYNKLSKISALTDRLRYSLEPYSIVGLRGIRGYYCGNEPDYRELSLEELDYIERDILKIKTYLESDRR